MRYEALLGTPPSMGDTRSMTRSSKVQYFDTEGRGNLPAVIKAIRAFLRGLDVQGHKRPTKVVFLTVQGEGPMLAYNQLQSDQLSIIAVTFPSGARVRTKQGEFFEPQISQRVRDFFAGVKIPIITNRLPFDEIVGADGHNREMKLLSQTLALFGSSIPLAVQAVLQATDAGYVEVGEEVIVATGDTALLVTATSTRMILHPSSLGFAVNEIICKPRTFTMSRAVHPTPSLPRLEGAQIEDAVEKTEC